MSARRTNCPIFPDLTLFKTAGKNYTLRISTYDFSHFQSS